LGKSSLVVLCAGSTLLLASTTRHQLSSGALSKVSLQQPSEVISFSYWSIKLCFHTEGKLVDVLITPSSWGFPMGPLRHQDCFLAPLPGRKRISARGVSHFQSLYFVIVLLSFFILSCLLLYIQKYKKIVPTIVVIFVGLLLCCFFTCFIMLSING
jgi:hypothetical protein